MKLCVDVLLFAAVCLLLGAIAGLLALEDRLANRRSKTNTVFRKS